MESVPDILYKTPPTFTRQERLVWEMSTSTYSPRTHERGVINRSIDFKKAKVEDPVFARVLVGLAETGCFSPQFLDDKLKVLGTPNQFFNRLFRRNNHYIGPFIDTMLNRVDAYDFKQYRLGGLLTGDAVGITIGYPQNRLVLFLDNICRAADPLAATTAIDAYVNFYRTSRQVISRKAEGIMETGKSGSKNDSLSIPDRRVLSSRIVELPNTDPAVSVFMEKLRLFVEAYKYACPRLLLNEGVHINPLNRQVVFSTEIKEGLWMVCKRELESGAYLLTEILERGTPISPLPERFFFISEGDRMTSSRVVRSISDGHNIQTNGSDIHVRDDGVRDPRNCPFFTTGFTSLKHGWVRD
ncbi:hypothetical protein A2631_00695 [Candidatus Daviesbacteria bacterium RIFCSPHIGHO2_01_FULL_44_29]|uniref:Uncharacterized protein n=1 Tax=Candidatus Daviesbacteria bacterium RIFCSPHIGHO2_02_FULL_43_12 TaxID=1797776 RepID=A0A1F5KHF0_9BACT|nr:MAG: hypothetical protein A2631_00695 [Candidatus Daviesbacteria bacterium RIFCSPHIGHO2_01_FULL_44_29]OGE39361.1 MAG: hypothetical protein A3E86_01550 [Candidatus Daviesbacteria bacterium RIFCSPHIGHO2_12_FULL_47_45]OGE40240.1 MAG: hypothetical protein A3D25_05160 [Candidatus Daviesbacteria bacterium RIFCSPHIGHO2_02_FULL_43_12]OGE69039.1 MAG: hypothetical protein A3B55_02240 [Candidatus Daviesbacteria bacterium RIFCSPLOWO2_01_FULL_43_15]